MRKTRKQYRLEALKRVLRLNRKLGQVTQLKKTKSKRMKLTLFSKNRNSYFIRMVKQEKL